MRPSLVLVILMTNMIYASSILFKMKLEVSILLVSIAYPFDTNTLSNLSCHCFGACFKLFNDLTILHTFLLSTWDYITL